MALTIRIAARRDCTSRELWELHRLRARVFKDRLGWDVPVEGGIEVDGYDAIEPPRGPLYMLVRAAQGGALIGCCRLLPTEGPYMLRDSFAELLQGQAAPAHPRIWELSRFAIRTGGDRGFGFSSMTLEALRAVFAHGHHHGVDEYVLVTTTSIERLFKRAGILTRRIGAPLRIGVATAVALYMDVAGNYASLCETRVAC